MFRQSHDENHFSSTAEVPRLPHQTVRRRDFFIACCQGVAMIKHIIIMYMLIMFINQLLFLGGEYHFFLPWHLGILAWSQICVCECLLNHHFLVGVFQYTVDGIGHDFFESWDDHIPFRFGPFFVEQGNQHRKLMGQSAKFTNCK